MRIFISDANILIDIIKLDLESVFFDLPHSEFYTTDFVYNEINEEQKQYLEAYVLSGKIIILESDYSDLMKINSLTKLSNGLSFPDCSIWHHTEKLKGILLTGDGKLRKSTSKAKIEVRGILFLFDEFLRCKLINFSLAIIKLNELYLLNDRLPINEKNKRLKVWGDGKCL